MRCVVLALLLASCGPSEPGATARFSPGGAPLAFADVPFPSDLYLDGAGRLALGEVPSRRSDEPFFDELRTLLAARDGFSTTGAIHFGIDGALDPASLPASAAADDAASIDDGVILIDADPGSPSRGALVPLRIVYDDAGGLVTARPARGFTLGPGHRWVAALTDALRGQSGAPLGAAPAFLAVRDGAPGVMPAIDEALAALEAAGVAREHVVVATAFTTEEPGLDLVRLREVVHGAPVPAFTVDRTYGPAELDGFYGVPAEDRPGVDVASRDVPTERAMQHALVDRVILGHFSAPRVVTGTGTDVGVALRDADGALVAGALEDVPFALVIPVGADLTSLPILVVQHGFNASRLTGLVFSDTVARAGFGVLSIDAFQHGARALDAMDERHDLRGSPGPDGLAETSVGIVSARTFGLSGPPGDLELFPTYPQGAFLQFAADIMSAVRALRDADPASLRAVDPSLASLSFRDDGLLYLGISMGSVIGASVLAAEPDLRGFILNVPPGSVTDTLCEGAEFRALATGPLANVLGIRGPFDEVRRSCANDPIVDLFRWAMEPIDPLALAPHFLGDRLQPGRRPDVMWVVAANDQLAAPPATESMLRVAGAPWAGAVPMPAFAAFDAVTLPATMNLTVGGEAITAVAVRCAPCSHGLPEVRGGTSDHADPLEPPLGRRETQLTFDNPIEAVHARITTFLTTELAGRATVE
jgi:hypothetical protein